MTSETGAYNKKSKTRGVKGVERFFEKAIELFIAANGILAIVVIAAIFLLLIREAVPLFAHTNFIDFFTGDRWLPVSSPPTFGLLPFLVGSLMITAVALVIALPLGLACAVYLAEIASPTVREIVKPLIELLAGIPSVVFGFIGLLILAPLVREYLGLNTGLTGLTAGTVLAFMTLPTIITISEDALSAVPKTYKMASLALGATRLQTIFKVLIPAAFSGITASVMLGMGRAIGETMTVLMVAGGRLSIPDTITDPMRAMTAVIASEIANAPQGGAQYQALFAVGLVLFIITFLINMAADVVLERQKRRFSS